MNKTMLLTALWFLTAGTFCPAAETPKAAGKLLITLNPDVIVDCNPVCLRQIAAMKGPQQLVDQAGNLTLGTFCTKGQVLYADRNTILSRLASIGILPGQVELLGAEKAQIHQNEKSVQAVQIVDAAKQYLQTQLTDRKVSFMQPIGTVSPVVLNDPNIPSRLSAAMSRYQVPGARKVLISISQGDIPIAQREVIFSVRYHVQQAVAQRDLPVGTIIQADDVRMEQVESSTAQSADWKEPFGMAVRRKIAKGTQVHPDWIGPVQAQTAVRRNQQVMVLLDTGAMHLSAPGQAMDEGQVGQLIRVKRGQRPDERIIYCTVQADGTVRPQI